MPALEVLACRLTRTSLQPMMMCDFLCCTRSQDTSQPLPHTAREIEEYLSPLRAHSTSGLAIELVQGTHHQPPYQQEASSWYPEAYAQSAGGATSRRTLLQRQ
jgi:hypothetical protein